MGPMRRGPTVFLLQAAKYVEPAFIEYYELLNLNDCSRWIAERLAD